jgi:hypothetical protein
MLPVCAVLRRALVRKGHVKTTASGVKNVSRSSG